MDDCYYCGASIPSDPWVCVSTNRERDRFRGYASDADKAPVCDRICRSFFRAACRGDLDDEDDVDATEQTTLDDHVPEQKTLPLG